MVDSPGLNRTSVGLKHGGIGLKTRGLSRPQSNQRGIETEVGRRVGG